MVDRVDPGHGPRRRLGIPGVPGDDLDGQLREGGRPPGPPVEAADGDASGEEAPDEVTPHEAMTTGDEDAHAGSIVPPPTAGPIPPRGGHG